MTGTLLSISNAAVGALVRLRITPGDMHQLLVVGRVSGRITARPVNVLSVGGRRYLVSPRGTTAWVRNARAGGATTLRRGRRTAPVRLVEIGDGAKPDLLREYLRRWGWQVASFVDGLAADSSADEFAAAAPRFPVFEIVPVPGCC